MDLAHSSLALAAWSCVSNSLALRCQSWALVVASANLVSRSATHPTNWETTASRVYVPMGSPGPATSTNPPELSMEVPAAPNQSWNKYDVAGYHLMQALFPPEILVLARVIPCFSARQNVFRYGEHNLAYQEYLGVYG